MLLLSFNLIDLFRDETLDCQVINVEESDWTELCENQLEIHQSFSQSVAKQIRLLFVQHRPQAEHILHRHNPSYSLDNILIWTPAKKSCVTHQISSKKPI